MHDRVGSQKVGSRRDGDYTDTGQHVIHYLSQMENIAYSTHYSMRMT